MNEMLYECAVCGKSYETVEERVECESKCVVERKEAEEERKLNELKMKEHESVEAINEALANTESMIREHFKQYSNLSLNHNYPYLKYVFSRTAWWF